MTVIKTKMVCLFLILHVVVTVSGDRSSESSAESTAGPAELTAITESTPVVVLLKKTQKSRHEGFAELANTETSYLNCDFESSQCNMADAGLEYSWRRNSGSSNLYNSNPYKPSQDSTLGTADGHYLMANFTETRSFSRGGVATPVIRQSEGAGYYCLRFSWGMNGDLIGLVGAYLVPEGSSDGQVLWLSEDSNGKGWSTAETHFRTTQDTSFRLVFLSAHINKEGQIGAAYLDDIDFSRGRCDEESLWGDWSSWTDCSQSCGGGSQRRTRRCVGNGDCPGVATETQSCNREDCPEWSEWTPWSQCHLTCGGGRQVRARSCTDTGCPGARFESQECNTTPCRSGNVVWECDWETPCTNFITSASNEAFNWQTRTGSTTSEGTGPSGDHTTGSGKYIYAEASNGNVDDQAILLSSPAHKSDNSIHCLSMWYHMSGSDMGRLDVVYVDINNTIEYEHLLNSIGDQGSDWKQVKGEFNTVSGDHFRLEIRASRGNGYQSDIAVDDVKVSKGTCHTEKGKGRSAMWSEWTIWGECSQSCGGGFQKRDRLCEQGNCEGVSSDVRQCDTETCPAMEPVWECNFNGACDDFIRTTGNDAFDWKRNVGPTQTDNTGPRGDHTTGFGDYIYTEASDGDRGERAGIRTAKAQRSVSETYCLNAWYHMYGSDTGSLQAYYTSLYNSSDIRPIWILSGEQGNQWRQLKVNFTTKVGELFNLVILAIRGNGDRGDMALDDLEVTAGECVKKNVSNVTVREWSSWGRCGVSCGSGRQARTRECSPKPCQVQTYQTKSCFAGVCPSTGVASSCGQGGAFGIIGGSEASEGQWPWQASIWVNNKHACGGTVINNRYILTAGHCVYLQDEFQNHHRIDNLRNVHINLGSNRNGRGTRYYIKRALAHPDYNLRTIENDIALIELSRDIRFTSFVKPACIPRKAAATGTKCHVSGFGRTGTSDSSPTAPKLKMAQQTIQSDEWCSRQWWRHRIHVYSYTKTFCAGPGTKTNVAFKGDSGGPFSCASDNGYQVQGVVSLGSPIQRFPNLYTDVFYYKTWIERTIRPRP